MDRSNSNISDMYSADSYDAMLRDIFEVASTSDPQRLGHDLNTQDDLLRDLLQRYSNNYNMNYGTQGPAPQRNRDAKRRDLEFLLQQSALINSRDKLGMVKKIEFNRDKMSTAEEVFSEAMTAFKSNLPENDQVLFSKLKIDGPEPFVDGLLNHIEEINTPHRSRLHDAMAKVASFADSFEPYFGIAELFFQSFPEYTSIAWGAVSLVFQISSQYIEYFEKLADMFSQISEKLPRYSRQFDLIGDRGSRREEAGAVGEWKWKDKKWDGYYVSLAKSLAYVYQDILSFCQDACSILPRQGLGKRQRIKRFMTRAWVPIDQRFSETMKRMKIHQQLFEEGLQEAYSTEMVIAFNDMDREKRLNRGAHQETHDRIRDFEIARVERDAHQQAALDALLARRAAEKAERAADKERMEKKTMVDKVRDLRNWIDAPDWTASLYAAEKHRADNTGDWLLRHPKYTSWAESQVNRSSSSEFSERLLFISGKPGYGKTVLSTRMISDFKRRVGKAHGEKGVVAFFHFNAQLSESRHSGCAFRAILTQLLHDNKDDTDFIDLASLLMEDSSGQNKATQREVESIIRVFLGRLGTSFLIFDGLDECEDWEDFLETLNDLTRDSACSVLCLGRPHLSGPDLTGENSCHIRLETKENLEDMRRYLKPKIQALHRRGKLPDSLSVDDIVEKITNRADSMFLWVVLMVSYLSSPLLTANNRLNAINNLHVLEGLDAMFKQILEDLKKRLPKSEWSKIQRMFQWLVVAQTPWKLSMLHTALAVQTSRPMTPEDYIEEFEESLVQTCGSFVEVYSDGTVRFIHLSVQEFLADPRPEFHNNELSQSFHVQKDLAHCSMSTLCLAYITHNIPHKPISSTEQKGAGIDELTATYPLLPYATKWWSVHACQSIRLSDTGNTTYSAERYNTLFRFIVEALRDKDLLSCWIETSYTFQNTPLLTTLESCVGAFQRKYPSLWTTQVATLVETLNQLSPELTRLDKSWGHILKKEPNEIWLPSINAVGKFNLWASSEDARMSFLESDDDAGSILIASQVSADGKSVGMLKIWTAVTNEESSSVPQTEYWEVAYQVWSLVTMTQLECIRFEIPQEQLLDLNIQNPEEEESTPEAKQAPTKFRFPVAFSSSLSLLVVHGILLKIAPVSIVARPEDRGHFQVLPPPGCEHTLDIEALSMARPMHTGRKRFSWARGFKIVPKDHKCHSWAQYLVSPDERYLIQINGTGPPAEAHNRRWIVSAYEDRRTDDWIPSFYLVASVGIQFRRARVSDNKVERFLSFHPFLPIVAVCRLATISLWHFMEKDKELVQIHDTLLDNISWSLCGNYLQGVEPATEQLVILDLRKHMPEPVKALEDSTSPIIPSEATPSMNIAASVSTATQEAQTSTELSATSSSPSAELVKVQTTTAPVFSTTSKGLTFSTLNQNTSNSSSIILQNIGPGGVVTNANLMRLPKSSTLEKSYSTLVNTGDDENLRLVLNMAAQETYTVDEEKDFNLPAVFDRKMASVESVVEEERFGRGDLRIFETVDGDDGLAKVPRGFLLPSEAEELQSADSSAVRQLKDIEMKDV